MMQAQAELEALLVGEDSLVVYARFLVTRTAECLPTCRT